MRGKERPGGKNLISGNIVITDNNEFVGWVVIFDNKTRLGIQESRKVDDL